MNSSRVRIVGATRLAPGQSQSFEFERGAERLPGFLLCHSSAGLVAYLNLCPHWSVDLDMGDERFYAEDIDRIYCKNHGALFRVADGVCDWGPCLGQSLIACEVELDGDDAWVTLTRQP
ncbi:MAG TPA: Rieske 2Fe-2S domain-containing protein [Polyangiaceae bacterium]|nr:Rieske 2Fe-2S domain-containing protein [Polyangiaceae bacterium]